MPFSIFGKRLYDLAKTLYVGQECEMWFEVAGREYQGKYYADNKCSQIKPTQTVAGVPPPQRPAPPPPPSTQHNSLYGGQTPPRTDDDIPFAPNFL